MQIVYNRTPPRQMNNFQNQVCQLKDGSREIVYVYLHVSICPGDFPAIVFPETLRVNVFKNGAK